MVNKFFESMRVVEFSSVLAGPATGMFFAELGAHVTKVENKNAGGDLTRKWKHSGEASSDPASSYYYSVNYNKEVLFLDLGNSEDNEIARALISVADLVITNFKEGDDEKFGLSPSSLANEFPSLIIAVIRGFEDSGRVAYDAVLQAESGFMSMNGSATSGPVKMPVALIDLLASHQLKEGILMALLNKLKTGRGAIVSVSLYQAAIASLANQASNWLNNGIIPGLQGSLHPTIAPYGECIETKDGQRILLAIGTDEQFVRLCVTLGNAGLAAHPDYRTNQMRITHRRELLKNLNLHSRNFSGAELMNLFMRHQVPAGRIKNMQEVFADPAAKQMVLTQQEPDGSISKRVQSHAFNIRFT